MVRTPRSAITSGDMADPSWSIRRWRSESWLVRRSCAAVEFVRICYSLDPSDGRLWWVFKGCARQRALFPVFTLLSTPPCRLRGALALQLRDPAGLLLDYGAQLFDFMLRIAALAHERPQ